MIVKKIPNPRTPSPKATRIGNLLDYIEGQTEQKLELRFAVGDFLTGSNQGQRAEMIALASETRRSRDPIDHWLLSWKAGEQPSETECREAVAILKRHLGMSDDHQAICALHRNTENLHLHIVVNRTDPRTFRVADNGWSIDRGHQALAEIVRRQAWEPEVHALYGAEKNGLRRGEAVSQPCTKARDFENATGSKSAERIAMEEVPLLLRTARSWDDVHSNLAAKGIRFEQKGSGALIWLGNTAVKASALGREFSRKRMEERFGPFQSAKKMGALPVKERVSEPLREGQGNAWVVYRAHLDKQTTEREAAQRGLRTLHRRARAEQQAKFRHERAELHGGGTWTGVTLNVARSLMAADQARRKVALSSQHRTEREALRKGLAVRSTYEGFLRAGGQTQAADLWRYRNTSSEVACVSGEGTEDLICRDIRDFTTRIELSAGKCETFIGYYAHIEPETLSFADRGKRIDIYQNSDRAAVLAALQLGSQKWGVLTISGPAEFQILCAELAREHDFQIQNVSPAPKTIGTSNVAGEPINPISPSAFFDLHRQDILDKLTIRNPSQIDWMVAVRMRVTGHDQETIAEALITNIGPERSSENRDWARYAQRTAEAVFGPRGDREMTYNGNRKADWELLEGRQMSDKAPVARQIAQKLGHRGEREKDLGEWEL